MHYTAFVPYSVTAGCSLTWQHSRSTACALLSDHGYPVIQAFFQALQSYSWGFALIQSLSKQRCKLFDSLVLPILSYACEVWAVDKEVGESAEQLHRQFFEACAYHLALEAALQPSLFWLSLAATLYISLVAANASIPQPHQQFCLMMNASFGRQHDIVTKLVAG